MSRPYAVYPMTWPKASVRNPPHSPKSACTVPPRKRSVPLSGSVFNPCTQNFPQGARTEACTKRLLGVSAPSIVTFRAGPGQEGGFEHHAYTPSTFVVGSQGADEFR